MGGSLFDFAGFVVNRNFAHQRPFKFNDTTYWTVQTFELQAGPVGLAGAYFMGFAQ